MKSLKTWAAAAAMVALTGAAQATLVSQGNGTVLDTATNLVWLQDWNVNGRGNWAAQKAWAENLTFAGSSDWVLPSYNDYATLFSEFGDLTAVSQFTNTTLGFYWSDTELVPGVYAWWFFPRLGILNPEEMSSSFLAVAVRPGDVAASVPEPQTLALALLALGATAVARRGRPD